MTVEPVVLNLCIFFLLFCDSVIRVYNKDLTIFVLFVSITRTGENLPQRGGEWLGTRIQSHFLFGRLEDFYRPSGHHWRRQQARARVLVLISKAIIRGDQGVWLSHGTFILDGVYERRPGRPRPQTTATAVNTAVNTALEVRARGDERELRVVE